MGKGNSREGKGGAPLFARDAAVNARTCARRARPGRRSAPRPPGAQKLNGSKVRQMGAAKQETDRSVRGYSTPPPPLLLRTDGKGPPHL